MGDLKWPSFIIQGIILATLTTFFLKGGGYINTWMFISLMLVLGLFSIQTTDTSFIYLFPVVDGEEAVTYKTHILRICIMVSISCLYMGIYHPNRNNGSLKDPLLGINGYLMMVLMAGFFLLILPLFFNFIKKKKA